MGYDTVTKQYLKSLAGGAGSGGGTSVDTTGFTMSGDINMGGNEVVGLGVLRVLIALRPTKSMSMTKWLTLVVLRKPITGI